MADTENEDPENGFVEREAEVDLNTETKQRKEREFWGRNMDFLVACVGGAVGLGNVWRFPYLCYKNGGGAFLIPYFVCTMVGSMPVFILEVTLGQYMSAGGMKAWTIVPLFQGVGAMTTLIIFYMSSYYNVVIAWDLMYLFHSFTDNLPWDSCKGEWNTRNCCSNFTQTFLNLNITNTTRPLRTYHSNDSFGNITLSKTIINITSINSEISPSDLVDSVTEFWERKVLGLSTGVEEIGNIKWDLALCLALAWVLVYLCICKGVRSTGKVMYFTAPAPYVFMTIILIRNATLPGAADGVRFYLRPDISKLSDLSVWVDALRQAVYSLGICQSINTTIGSYNRFKHNSLRDSVAVVLINGLTSFFAGFLVFTILGFMAYEQGRSIEEVAESGPGLAFIAYPKAVAQMPLAQLWSALFFLMILLLGLDSQFVGVEALVTACVDQLPGLLRWGSRKELFVACLCAAMLLVGLVYVTNGGMYVFQLVDYYGGSRTLLLAGFIELVVITYVYGIRRFRDNLEMMVGMKWTRWMYPYLAVCWTLVTPVVCLGIFTLDCVNYQDLTYKRSNGSIYTYPKWSVVVGWMLNLSAVCCIPLAAFHLFYKFGFSAEVLKRMLVPYGLKSHQMRPQDKLEKCLRDLSPKSKYRFSSSLKSEHDVELLECNSFSQLP